MAVVGFSFSKILIEKKAPIKQNIEVKSSIHMKNISKEAELKLVEGKDTLKFEFEYTIDYVPDLAKIEFQGHLLVVVDPKETESILQDWKKGKKIKEDLQLRTYNSIFNKCNVKAFQLEEDFNLPLHLRLPMIEKSKK